MFPRTNLAILVCVITLSFATAPDDVSAQSLTISPTNPTISVGQTQQFTTPDVSGASGVEAGDYHVCAQLQNGEVRCFGRNNEGQLGTGGGDSPTPISPIQFTQGAGVTAGGFHSCAVRLDHTVQCWGMNDLGQLGNGTTTQSTWPSTVSGITNAIAVGAGYHHTCALLQDGRVKCWGDNTYGQLGDGAIIPPGTPRGGFSTLHSSVPVTVVGITNAVSVTASDGYHSCAVLQDGTVKCWGDNGSGQLGDGTRNGTSTPVTVVGINNAVSVSSGDYHTCALLQGGALSCWGLNWTGQLGNGTGNESATPVMVSGITNAVNVSAGVLHSCAALADGTARCWGYNANGQIGDGTTNNAYGPAVVSGITSALSVAAGNNDSCAVLAGGLVRCWGWNIYGELGNGTTTDASTPTVVVDLNPTWTSSDSTVATIDATGLASGVGPGSATITATFDFWVSAWDRSMGRQTRTGSATLQVGNQVRLTVVRNGNGSVTSSPSGIDCGSTCSALFDTGTTVTLTAAPAGGSTFTGWSGCDSASGTTCTVAMNASRTVSATFTMPVLTVQLLGSGRGTATSGDSAINCQSPSTSCSATYGNGTAVTLSASPSTGSLFTGWHFCDSTNDTTCGVTMNGSRTIAVGFMLKRYTLWVERMGTGNGTVNVSGPGGFTCGPNWACAGEFDHGTTVTATATADSQSVFVGWTGCDEVSGNTCRVTMVANTTIRPTFLSTGVPLP